MSFGFENEPPAQGIMQDRINRKDVEEDDDF